MAYDADGGRQTGSTDPGAPDDPSSGGHPPYRTDTGSLPASTTGFPVGDFRADQAVARLVTANDVDDPTHGEPGRDRMRVHAWWELLLLVGAAVLAFLVHWEDPGALRGAALDSLLVSATTLGLLALAAGVTLRAGAPNLAIGPVAVFSALYFAEQGDRVGVAAVLPAALAAAGLGLVLALFVVVFHVPGWAASLGAALALVAVIGQWTGPVEVRADYDPTRHASYLFGALTAVTVLGGLFGTVKTIRRAVGGFRPVADPALRRGGGAALLVTIAVALSTVFAMSAGVLLASGGSAVEPSSGFQWTGLALGAALLGGTSAFGRRGGVFGTLLTVVLLTLFATYADQQSWHVAPAAVAAVAIAAGLAVTRMVERFGRPWPWDGDEGEEDHAAPWTADATDRQESWSSVLPAQPTDSHAHRWTGERWDAVDR